MVTNAYRVAMTLNVGDPIPSVDLFVMGAAGPEKVNTADVLGSGKVVLFAVPGAFTPGCSKVHLPGFVQQASELTGKGVDRIACLSVNDAFVMGAWGKSSNADAITMLADGNGDFAETVGLTMDGSKFGMGLRSQRYAMLVEDGVVKELNVEAPGEFKVSAADYMLAQL